MNFDHPTFAFSIVMEDVPDGPEYWAYGQGYGLEMTMDDEWPVNTIILAAPHLITELTQNADVCSMGAIPGASHPPVDDDYEQITRSNGEWVLARTSDDLTRIVASKLGVLLYAENVDEFNKTELPSTLNDSNLILAYKVPDNSTPETAREVVESVRRIDGGKFSSTHFLISATIGHENLLDFARMPSVNGLLILDESSNDVVDLIQSYLSE